MLWVTRTRFQPLRMLERTEETKMHPGQRIIFGFLSDETQPLDEQIVSGSAVVSVRARQLEDHV